MDYCEIRRQAEGPSVSQSSLTQQTRPTLAILQSSELIQLLPNQTKELPAALFTDQ